MTNIYCVRSMYRSSIFTVNEVPICCSICFVARTPLLYDTITIRNEICTILGYLLVSNITKCYNASSQLFAWLFCIVCHHTTIRTRRWNKGRQTKKLRANTSCTWNRNWNSRVCNPSRAQSKWPITYNLWSCRTGENSVFSLLCRSVKTMYLQNVFFPIRITHE